MDSAKETRGVGLRRSDDPPSFRQGNVSDRTLRFKATPAEAADELPVYGAGDGLRRAKRIGPAISTLDRKFTRILGVEFFHGTVEEAVERMRNGGLLVVPSAPTLKDMDTIVSYREAVLGADLAITDSAFMVLLWNRLQHDSIPRLSGLAYLRALLRQREVQRPGGTLWVMASPESAERNLTWLRGEGIAVPRECVYLAPIYGPEICDTELLRVVEQLKPQHVIVTVGGGRQEQLGLFLKRNLSYLPAIHCIGAAIAFLSGDQVHIPVWADRLYLGWFFRSLSEPSRYIPRYWEARKLFRLMLRYRERVPELVSEVQRV